MNLKNLYNNFRDMGLNHQEADEKVKNECIEKRYYTEFISYLLKQYYSHNEYADSFLEVLVAKQLARPYTIYWKARLSEEIRYIWELVSYYKNEKDKKFTTEDFLSYSRKELNENQDKYPAMQDSWLNFVWHWYNTLDFIDNYVSEMEKINASEEIARAKILRESVYNLKKPKAKKTTDKRKINEDLFWELIEESRQEYESDSEFVDILKDKLEAMSATEIKKFQKILLEKTNELEHWDIWALAYIVRGGCGDDAFDYFKAWVVSQGKDAFEYVKNMQIKNLKILFKNNDPQFEEFMYVAQEAYENKKNEMMPDIRVKSQEIQGEQWKEDSICKRYPKLCKLFDYKY